MVNGFRLNSTWIAVLAAAAMTACTVKDQSVPPLTGPSEAALSVSITATPDSILQDGASQSSIVVLVRDANAKPISGQTLRVDMAVNGTVQDYGTLSARTIVTGTDGRATTVYTAPPTPPGNLGGSGSRVQIVVAPTGTNYATASPQTVDIKLVPPGVIIPAAETPTASFTYSPTSPALGTPVQFNAAASCGGATSGGACTSASKIVSYSWDFGDGKTATGQLASHLFATIQSYNVTLTVTNDRGLSASTTQTLSVGTPATATSASFVWSPDKPVVGQSAIFDASTSTSGANITIVDYAWGWGDATPIQHTSSKTIAHQFNQAGVYTVSLTVTDSVGLTNTKTNAVTVVANASGPTASFTISQTPTTVGYLLTFDGSGSRPGVGGGAIVRWEWDYGDGSPIDSQGGPTATHAYSARGPYSVKLKVTDVSGNTGSIAQTLVVQ